MSNPRLKNLKYAIPIMFLGLGIFFSVMAATMGMSAGFTFKLFTAGPGFILLGIGTIAAPVNIPVTDSNTLNVKEILEVNAKWKWAVWAAALIVGIIFQDDILILFAKWFG
jgi:hypothetical protein